MSVNFDWIRSLKRRCASGADLDRLQPALAHLPQRVEHVVDLRLDHEHHRVVAEADVRADELNRFG